LCGFFAVHNTSENRGQRSEARKESSKLLSDLCPLTSDLCLSNGRPTPAAPIVKKKQLRLVPQGKVTSPISSDAATVLLAVSNTLFIFKLPSLLVPPFSHFDPFGTELM
jgi:hypothetical protein